MTPEFSVELLKTLVMQCVSLAIPFLAVAMVIGLLVSLFQAVTTIHEQTLTFVPKALGVVAMLLILMPWLVRSMVEFTASVFEKIPQMAQ
ncbi:MAG TPA: flagellar biosynthesis protein FliQ [Candidatus Acidoferrum sp.]|nr:flagellar biosynthesis protein FliQ [Candidatus Acidoferrum sp.]